MAPSALEPRLEPFDVGGLQGHLFVRNEPQSLGITLVVANAFVATVSADEHGPGHWWIVRCLVQPQYRSLGLGAFSLARLQALVSARPGFSRLEVSPGGYDSDPVRVRAFYERAGFRRVGAEETYVWTPDPYRTLDQRSGLTRTLSMERNTSDAKPLPFWGGEKCYACEATPVGIRDRRPEGGDIEVACERHADPTIEVFKACRLCNGRLGNDYLMIDGQFIHTECERDADDDLFDPDKAHAGRGTR